MRALDRAGKFARHTSRRIGGSGRTPAPVRRVGRWIYDRAIPTTPIDTVHGFKMCVHQRRDEISNVIAKTGEYEPTISAAILGSLAPGDTAVDVGAHIGFHTMLMAQAVGPTGRVHAFEPVPDNVALLRRNVQLNGFDHVTVHPVAAWDGSVDSLDLNFQPELTGGHSALAREGRKLRVDAAAVQALVPQRPVRFAKIDVEGAETQAIAGMTELIAGSPGITVLTEYFERLLDESGTEHSLLFSALAELGLTPKRVIDGDEVRPYASAADLSEFCSVEFG